MPAPPGEVVIGLAPVGQIGQLGCQQSQFLGQLNGLPTDLTGDPAKGGELAKGCACHKSKGDLDGVDAAALTAKMQAYKDGKGDNKAMIAIMKKQSDQDMADLAAYYASLPKK